MDLRPAALPKPTAPNALPLSRRVRRQLSPLVGAGLLAAASGACVDWEGATAEYCGDSSLCRGDERHQFSRPLGGGGTTRLHDLTPSGTAGDVVLAGSFLQRATFGTLNLETAGGLDGLVLRLNKDGGPVWARTLGGSAEDQVRAVIPADGGSVTVAGSSQSPQLAVSPSVSLSNAGAGIGFVARLSAVGDLQWAVNLSTATELREPRGLAPDGAGNVLVTGVARSAGAAFDSLLVARLSAEGASSAAVLASCSDGSIRGSQVLGSSGGIFVVGDYTGSSCALSSGKGLPATSGTRGLFVLKLDAQLAPVWVSTQQDANLPREGASSLALARGGNLLVASESQGVVVPSIGVGTPAPGTTRAFVAEVDASSGAFVWATGISGTGALELQQLTVGPDGVAWAAGHFGGNVTASERERSSRGGSDVLVLGVAPGGAVKELLSFGEEGDQASTAAAYGTDALLLAGPFQQRVAFGSEPLQATQQDLFLAGLKL